MRGLQRGARAEDGAHGWMLWIEQDGEIVGLDRCFDFTEAALTREVWPVAASSSTRHLRPGVD